MRKQMLLLGLSILFLGGCGNQEVVKETKENIPVLTENKVEAGKSDSIETVDVTKFKEYLEQVEKADVLIPRYTVLDPKHTTTDADVYKQYLNKHSDFIGDIVEKPMNVTVFRQTHMSMDGENRELNMIAYLSLLPLDLSSFKEFKVNDDMTGYFRENEQEDFQQVVFEKKGFTYVIHLKDAYGAYHLDQYKQMVESY